MELLSLPFFLLCLSSAIWLTLTRGWLRSLGFSGACAWYASSFLGPEGIATTLGFVVLGYGVARAAQRGRALYVGGLVLLLACFFVLRGYLGVPQEGWGRYFVPAGLSFLFFKILHVVIDARAGTLRALSPWTYFNYCLAFPTFLLGPIQRYPEFERQWSGAEPTIESTFEAHLDAVNRVLRGLVKKYVLAESLADYALQADADVEHMSLGALLLACYAFYFLLYFDFSGYCDVMIGAGALIGVKPPENFRLPFLATNIADFWLRVHRSLTRWLTDYVFNPSLAALLRTRALGTRPLLATSLALLCTMIVSGVWHGTTLSFLAFGLLHGLYVVGYRLWEAFARARLGRAGLARLRARPAWQAFGVLLTFQLTSMAFPCFVLDSEALGVLWGRLLP